MPAVSPDTLAPADAALPPSRNRARAAAGRKTLRTSPSGFQRFSSLSGVSFFATNRRS
jgi:hypothetical protein